MSPVCHRRAMADRIPSIRKKNTGNHFVRWGGRDWSLGTDPDVARKAWLDPASTHPGRLAAWQAWRAAGGGAVGRPRAGTPSTSRRSVGTLVVDAVRDMLESYERRGHAQSARSLRSSLKRFVAIHGATPMVELATANPARGLYLPPLLPKLEALRDDMLTPDEAGLAYAAHTINHDLGAVRLLFQHAAARGWCPAVSFDTLRFATPPAASPEDLSPAGVSWLLRIARHTNPHLAPLLAAQYLTLVRSSEVLELVAAWRGDASAGLVRSRSEWGHDVGDRGLVELLRHKNAHRGSTYRRFVVISPAAATALDEVRGSPRWTRADGYEHAALRAILTGPRVLRDSGASNLRLLGVDSADVDLLLGHQPRGAIGSYARAPWPALRERAARLSHQCEFGWLGCGACVEVAVRFVTESQGLGDDSNVRPLVAGVRCGWPCHSPPRGCSGCGLSTSLHPPSTSALAN